MPELHRLYDAKLRALSLSRALFSRLEEYSDDYQGFVPHRLIEKLKLAVDAIDRTIEQGINPDSLGFICTAITDLAREVLPLLDHAHRAQTPRGLWQIISHLHKTLGLAGETFPTTSDAYEYTIADHSEMYLDLIDGEGGTGIVDQSAWHAIFDDFPQILNVVQFPRLERDNVLLYPIFGHEFGHESVDSFIQPSRKTIAANDGEMVSWSQSAVAKNKDLAKRLGEEDLIDRIDREAEYIATIEAAYSRGLQELLSDLVAVRIFGPSALFAAAEILIPDGLDTIPAAEQFYPPPRMRIRGMLSELDRMGHIEALQNMLVLEILEPTKVAVVNYLSELRSIADQCNDEAKIDSDPLLKIAYKKIKSDLQRGIKHAEAWAKLAEYDSTLIVSEVPDALERISLGVPPTQIDPFGSNKAINWRSAILVGWLRKIYLSSDVTEATEAHTKVRKDGALLGTHSAQWAIARKKIDSCKSLTLRAVEDIFLLEEYASWRLEEAKLEGAD